MIVCICKKEVIHLLSRLKRKNKKTKKFNAIAEKLRTEKETKQVNCTIKQYLNVLIWRSKKNKCIKTRSKRVSKQ